MLIPVSFDSQSSSGLQKLPPSLAKISHDEVVLLDLQGALEVESAQPNERDGKLVGTLSIDKDLKRPTLRIGHHFIEGKLVNLPKPLAVLHRTTVPSPISQSHWPEFDLNNDTSEDTDVVMNEQDSSSIATQWNVLAVVKRKILFSKRPMPIVGRPA
ncbi:chromosome transmission fidelity protein 8 [Lentinula raphanica]|uniref:Chromosome transmission fidelity protein 8 n=1 Tax=Lentinula raphanica TaxID=153919 RepID=A0AA38PKY0_9AGAR|nr:chromosome transmission fidelity protein 8 [Lentinula raphanica]KAJ3829705.1 chromosome transmission fidelity protein 8 [Lentinula raphanica]KAJ3844804.1 chromosome transmission fidelity protein 8 [Lentinula raphanica]KAJ3977248.1 chromosome transmission fidelity protein 8 [Lentinula raphanica]